MKKGLFNRRIPTILALLVLVAIIGISTVLIQSGVFYVGRAAPDSQPQNFSITNITDTSFTAVFTTSAKTDAVISMNGSQTGSTIILDDRDKKSGSQSNYYSHHITVPDLSPQRNYTFNLIVNGKNYQDPSYKITTGAHIESGPPAQNPLFGKVLLPDGTIGEDSIVIAGSSNSQKISSVTDSKGEFILPTNSLRENTNSTYFNLSSDSPIEIQIFRQTMKSSITTIFKTAQNLPTVTLLQQYSFVAQDEEPIDQKDSQLSFVIPVETQAVSIIYPKEDENLTDQRPTFKGTSYPNSDVTIRISKFAQQQVLAKADGSWTYQKPEVLDVGEYTLTVTANDASNKKTTLTRTFTILPLGSQVIGDPRPTSSPTPIKPTSIPTATPTPIQSVPSIKPTATPVVATPTTAITTPTPTLSGPTTTSVPATPTTTATPIPTATTTPIPTIATSPTSVVTPTNRPTISDPGGITSSIALTGFSILLIVAGLVLLFAL